ncbi:hypothetical protein [Pedobacter alpinus]|uniref:Uncharacterized protein n=1 Tax=Pedobacter alpinus TaxID=1590643 RepID=A0ABW5TSQ1_9SPHI
MRIPDLENSIYKNDLTELIKKVKTLHKDLGGYIEHFYYNDQIIIVKLTNGIIKINETVLEKHQTDVESVSDEELKKIGSTFIKTLL